MSARKCFSAKIRAGVVKPEAGRQILDMLDGFEAEYQTRLGDGANARQAALAAAAAASREARDKAAMAAGLLKAQSNVLRASSAYAEIVTGLRAQTGDFGFGNKAPLGLGRDQSTLGPAMRSLLVRDTKEIARWGNVDMEQRMVRGGAHARFAEGIDKLRSKLFGFKHDRALELDVMRAHFGADAGPVARAVYTAWDETQRWLAQQFRAAGGSLPERPRYLPNPDHDRAKVTALGRDRWKALVDDTFDVLDFDTGKPLDGMRRDRILNEIFDSITGVPDMEASSAFKSRTPLAHAHAQARALEPKNAEAWLRYAEQAAGHTSIYGAMIRHIEEMSRDIGLMRVLGPNPEATKRFILDLFSREANRLAKAAPDGADAGGIAGAVRDVRKLMSSVNSAQRGFELMFDEVTGLNRVPINTELAHTMAEVRGGLVSSQMGGALLASLADPAMLLTAARHNGLSATNVAMRAIRDMADPAAEIRAAQAGLIADTLVHGIGAADRYMGETVRGGWAAQAGSAVIRMSGLRKWTHALRHAFGLEMMAYGANQLPKAFADLDVQFREALGRVGIDASGWEVLQAAVPHETRPGAPLLRVMDIERLDSAAARDLASRWSRLINTEMDHAVIDSDAITHGLMMQGTRPGTIPGESLRAAGMYKNFALTIYLTSFARMTARGWDGSRLGHAALTFLAMTGLGAVAMQAKELAAGRDPLSLDPSTPKGLQAWGKATLQGGGLGAFGDLVFTDKTKYGNSWTAQIAGPLAGAAESVMGDFLSRNIIRAARGEETHFAGDAAFIAARYLPGSTLWPTRLAFQRTVLDQLQLAVDPRTAERFARIEQRAAEEWGQSYWWRPGRTSPDRAPEFDRIGGQ